MIFFAVASCTSKSGDNSGDKATGKESAAKTVLDAAPAPPADAMAIAKRKPRPRPGPPGAIVSNAPGPPWPAKGVKLVSGDGKTTVKLKVKDGVAIGKAIESFRASKRFPADIAKKFDKRLATLESSPPMADGPRVGHFLLRASRSGLEAVATLQILAHHRTDLVLDVWRSGKSFSIRKARLERAR